MVWRVLRILGGLFIAFANAQGDANSTLGFIPLDGAGSYGFNFAKLGIYWLAFWLIYRGFKPKTSPPAVLPTTAE